MNHDEWLERAEIYALGALDGEELARFEAHLAEGCQRCEERLAETRETLTLLPRSLPPLVPPPAVKARLLEQIARESAPLTAERPWPGWLWWGAGTGALAAAGLLIVLSWTLATTREALQSLQGQVAALRVELAQQEETLQFVSDPQVRLVHLAGREPSLGAVGRLLWNPVTRTGLLFTSGLPPAPPEKTYELWGISGAEPVPAGVFTVDREGRALLRLPSLPEARTFDKFAVTLEPAGGVPKPSGPMYLLGSL
jgi:anti-sigma-K factor RskA